MFGKIIFDQWLAFRLMMHGDYSDDEIIDHFDYAVWRMTYDMTGINLPADGNRNGIVDLADYTVWRGWTGTSSTWYQSTTGVGSLMPFVDIVNPPKVTNVTVSGSSSVHAPYSFAGVVGDGDQLRTVPVGGADTISITFSEDVNVVAHRTCEWSG